MKKNGGNVTDILGCGGDGIGHMSPVSTHSSRQVLIDEDCDVAAEKQMVEELSKSSDRQDVNISYSFIVRNNPTDCGNCKQTQKKIKMYTGISL